MKAINIGSRFEIYGDSLKTYDQLPTQVYSVRFEQMTGFYLERHSDIKINEKIYGVHEEKVEKVLQSFAIFERSLGVILSGHKGIGKSLFAKLLAIRAVKEGIPVLIVDRYIPDIASYLESIDQQVMILFDEFDKTFGDGSFRRSESSPQNDMLTLFDGIAQGKKLYVITCNQLQSLSDYLLNRLGRYHYHFRFEYPSAAEIQEYLGDKLRPDAQGEIEKVIAFSKRIDLNYDCLRAIAFELNRGESFERAIADLNIINVSEERYTVTIHFSNGKQYTQKNAYLDLFDSEKPANFWTNSEKGYNDLHVEFDTQSCIYDGVRGVTTVAGEDLRLTWDEPETHEGEEWAPMYATITRAKGKNYHYLAA